MKKYFTRVKLLKCIWILILFIVLFLIDLKSIFNDDFTKVFRSNISYINYIIDEYKIIMILILLIILYFRVKSNFVFKLEKMKFFGVTVNCKDTERIFKQSIKSYLDTKRTLFRIELERDNYYDVIKSYYECYNFIRLKMAEYEIKNSDLESYKAANEMIKELNKFLTKYQCDYRRWYEYIIENRIVDLYDEDINKIQKRYRKYNEIREDFIKFNNEFRNCSKHFGINISNWD